MKITLRRLGRRYDLNATEVVRVVPTRELGVHSPIPGLQMGFVMGCPVLVSEPDVVLESMSGGPSLQGPPSTGTSAEGQEPNAEWVVVMRTNGDCHQAVMADEVDWKAKEQE
ncbi:MAG: hypothetical protein RLZZ409_700 [Pseudomonadota bacterium]|jgi:hypothetical protein